MTGLWVLSDLHINAGGFDLPPTPAGAEVLVVAGDVGEGWHQAVSWLQAASRRSLPIVFVAGNHELFGHDFFDTHPEELDRIGVHLLEPTTSIEIDGTRFVGGTLWTDFAVAGDQAAGMWWSKGSYPDYWNIDVGMRRLRPADLLEAHRKQLAAMEVELSTEFDGPTVVVTHHAPHPQSLRGGVISGPADGSWGSDLSAVIERYQPALWVHGHVHESRDYTIGETRIVCNPRGYGPAGNPVFRGDLVIDVERPEPRLGSGI